MSENGFDEEEYKSKVNECSNIRLGIDTNWGKLRKYGEVFCEIFGLPMPTFMLVHRADYYGSFDGTDDDQKPAQLMTLVKKFAETVKYCRAFGLTADLDRWLEENGITVKAEPLEMEPKPLNFQSNIEKIAHYMNVDPSNIPLDTKGIARTILDETHKLQAKICRDADFIKKHTAKEVKEEFQIEVPHFVNAVRIDANRRLEKTSKGRIDKMHVIADSAENSVSIFEGPAVTENESPDSE